MSSSHDNRAVSAKSFFVTPHPPLPHCPVLHPPLPHPLLPQPPLPHPPLPHPPLPHPPPPFTLQLPQPPAFGSAIVSTGIWMVTPLSSITSTELVGTLIETTLPGPLGVCRMAPSCGICCLA